MKNIVIIGIFLLAGYGATFAGTNLIPTNAVIPVETLLQRYDSNTLRVTYNTWDAYYKMEGSTNRYGIYSKELENLLTNSPASKEKFIEFQSKATGAWILYGIGTTAYLGGGISIIILANNDLTTNNAPIYLTALLGTMAIYIVTGLISGSMMTEASESLSQSVWQYNRSVLINEQAPVSVLPFRKRETAFTGTGIPVISYSFSF